MKSSRVWVWKDTTVVELKNFLGLYFITGIVKLPAIWMYWSTDPKIGQPIFRQTMPRNRFQLLCRFIHFNHGPAPYRGQPPKPDPLWKVRKVMDTLLSSFKAMYTPQMNIAIDEGTLLWRGRLVFRIYNAQKPIKYGIRSYILADSAEGYCWAMKPYCKESATHQETVQYLLGDLKKHGYHLYMDNLYNGVPMSETLLTLGTHTCGTLRRNRGEPTATDVNPRQLEIHERIVRHNGLVMIISWKPKKNKVVKVITTIHQDVMVRQQQWNKDTGAREVVNKPQAVVAYNHLMNGVDKMDQNICYYPWARKSHKWSTKFILYMFQITMYNAFVIHRMKSPKPLTMMNFILEVSEKWACLRPPAQFYQEVREEEAGVVQEAGEEEGAVQQVAEEAGAGRDPEQPSSSSRSRGRGRGRGKRTTATATAAAAAATATATATAATAKFRTPSRDSELRLTGDFRGHFLDQIPRTGKKKYPQKPCRVCHARNPTGRNEARYFCKVCKVPLHLHCFEPYHTLKNYARV